MTMRRSHTETVRIMLLSIPWMGISLRRKCCIREMCIRDRPKDVQELLGHSDVSTIMNVYAHATREAKRTSARLLDKVAGND